MTETSLGDTLAIDEQTLLLLGQGLDIAHDQPDVGNAVVHRTGDTLVIVDTGVTPAFRDALMSAARRLGPAPRILLLNTHGHVDHIGNNDVVDALAAEWGATAEHWLPAGDVAQMVDPVRYWQEAFGRVTGVVGLPAPPGLAGKKIVSLFRPLHPFGNTTRTLEERPSETFEFGGLRVAGWAFADGAVRVVRSQGHCAGHVVVLLRDSALLHLGDEPNGPCGPMPDADQLKIQTILGLTAAAIADGDVTHVTEGHSPLIRTGEDARSHYAAMVDHAAAIHSYALGYAAGHDQVVPAEFTHGLQDFLAGAGGEGPNPNPVFTGMMALNVLGDLGYAPAHGVGGPWSAEDRTDPEPVAGQPHGAALIPAAVSMTAWKLRHRDRDPHERDPQ